MSYVLSGGQVAVKEFEEDRGGKASEVLRSKHHQGFINELVGGTAVDQSGDGASREREVGVEKKGVGGLQLEMCWEGVQRGYYCTEDCSKGREDISV
ncbi:hypothetical protein C0989_002677 [Termitomyces sp. Mn162]|nr:hypothetical protein C0989_002677 [Termitomyces sp. Mn162]